VSQEPRTPYGLRPLDPVRSIKTKLGALVAVTVAVATLLAVLATRAGWSPWLVVPVAVLVGLGVTQLLARGMTKPLRDMTIAAGHMAQGDYTQRVRTDSRDEVGELARAFNRMVATLELVDRQRRDLVANVSHELRTPITALQAVLENLVDGVTTPDAATLAAAHAQTERLSRLVSDLLDLSRVDAGIAPFRVADVVVAELLEDAVNQARTDGLRYAVRVDPADLTVPGDPERLHQLLANLLDNAARHSPAGGEIRVAATVSGDDVVLTVADQGPGIAPADREAVFERFTTSSAQHSGTGLGLAIARWVAQLHGGAIGVADSATGALLRVTLPRDHDRPVRHQEAPTMSTLTPPAPMPASPPPPPGALELRRFWPDAGAGRPGVVAACAVAGMLAALIWPDRPIGLGVAFVFAVICGVVLLAGRWRRPFTWLDWADVALVTLLIATLVVRDAAWITVLCLLAALALVVVNVTKARTVIGMLLGAASVPFAALRGLPWLGRSLRPAQGVRAWLPVVRTVLVTLVLLVVFGALFASADAVFATWVDAITPNISIGDVPARIVLGVFIAAGTLAAAYVALAPPAVDSVQIPLKASRRRFEWLAPLVAVDGVFAVFLVAQATALFGGHAYLRETTGLTYADYVHQGFGQLTVATVLTLTVIAWVAHKAPADLVRNLALGALGVMTLVVVVSALYRMSVYEEAYGFTRLRLLVSVFEGWLGVVVLLVLVAGALGRAGWLVPTAVRLGAVGLLGLAVLNPDLWIAEHNLARQDTATVPVDYTYLGGLSADAYPALWKLPQPEFACVTGTGELTLPDRGDWLDWNHGRSTGLDLAAQRPPATTAQASAAGCDTLQR
jgi:signal transduction histidine kinase